MRSDPNDPLFESAIFGRQVQDFLASDIGRYLIRRAEEEAAIATADLKKVLPIRWSRITELQNRIYRAESIQKWLGEAIMEGITAEQVISGEDNG